MTPTLAILLASPCCPGCLRTATRIDRTPESGEDAPIRDGEPLPALHVWAAGVLYDDGSDDVHGCGYWAIRCSCDGDGLDGFGEATIPTVRSLTPAAVLALLGEE